MIHLLHERHLLGLPCLYTGRMQTGNRRAGVLLGVVHRMCFCLGSYMQALSLLSGASCDIW